jgi:aryl-alcohol dehydrogenase-like predicted oxidoreductase
MKYRLLGKTGFKVSEVGFGAWAIGGNKFGNSYGATDDSDSFEALKYAFNQGCNFFDTADLYGRGHSERLIGELGKLVGRENLILATKVGSDFYSGRVKINFTRDYIRYALSESLKRLQTDYLDLYQLHNPPLELIQNGYIFEIMRELKKEGYIRSFGICIDEDIEGIEALKHSEVDTIQVVYSIFERDPENQLFEYTDKLNIGVIAREPLDNGLLTGKYTDSSFFPAGDIRHMWPVTFIRVRLNAANYLKPLLKDELDSLVKLAIKFVLTNDSISTVIPGCKTLNQTKENMSISDLRNLALDEIEKIHNLYSKKFHG